MLLVDNLFSIDQGIIRRKDAVNSHTHLISHGHFDHLPSRLKDKRIISSLETLKMVELRRKRQLELHDQDDIQLLPAGHTLGSTMFFFKEEKLLYTGDFNTIPKYCGQAKPKKCDTLIIEATYGRERYIFPSYKETVKEFLEFVQERPATIDVYPFGKAQEVAHLLNKARIPFSIGNAYIKQIHEQLGLSYRYESGKADIVLGKERLPGFRHVLLTGWALDARWGRFAMADKVFPLSDHADFPSLVEFVQSCDPKQVFTFHGSAKAFAQTLRKAGIPAQVLLEEQLPLQSFLNQKT